MLPHSCSSLWTLIIFVNDMPPAKKKRHWAYEALANCQASLCALEHDSDDLCCHQAGMSKQERDSRWCGDSEPIRQNEEYLACCPVGQNSYQILRACYRDGVKSEGALILPTLQEAYCAHMAGMYSCIIG